MDRTMDRKIIFFDIDGTITSHRDLKISDSTRNAIRQAQANGHMAFINTGRTLAELDASIKAIGFDGYICGCGTYIVHGDTVLMHKTISPAMIKELILDIHKYQLDACLEGSTAIYYNNEVKAAVFQAFRKAHANHGLNIRTWEDPDIDIDKFCVSPLPGSDFNSFYKKYDPYFDFIDREDDFYEIMPKGHSKASGIIFLCSHLNIPHENTYALGDSNNDYAMLKYVKHSIAMGNSSEELLKMASFVTKDVDDGGVAHALKHFQII